MESGWVNWPTFRSVVGLTLAASLAIGIFILDTIAPLEAAFAVLYVAVVLIAARFLQSRGLVLVALGCIALAGASHVLSRIGPISVAALINLGIGVGAIITSAYVGWLDNRSRQALRERADLLDTAHDAIFIRDLADVISYWNRGAEERYGWTAAQALGKVSHELLQTEFPVPLAIIKDELMRTGRWEGELVHTARGGAKYAVLSRWSQHVGERGRPVGTLETNNDITRQKQADAELRASERRYRNIFQSISTSIWEEDFTDVKRAIDALKGQGVTDFRRYLAEHPEFIRQGIDMVKVLDVNDASVELFGARHKDELLSSLDTIFLPETDATFAEELIALAEDRTKISLEAPLTTLKGERLDVLFTLTFPDDLAGMSSVLVAIVDITERKRSQQALDRAQAELAHVNRVSTLGELAASIAHEVNQPLAGIVANARAAIRWLQRSPPDLGEARQVLDDIAADGRRAGEIVGRIHGLARKAPLNKELIDLNQVILDVVLLTHNEVGRSRVRLQTDLEQRPISIMGDRVHLQQVMLNFILNAVEATSGVDKDRRNVIVRSAVRADGIVVSVCDTGVGLDPERVDELFKPFYSTKPSGMGMGLSICRSIIEAHGGQVQAMPNADAGATFQFTLPARAREDDAG